MDVVDPVDEVERPKLLIQNRAFNICNSNKQLPLRELARTNRRANRLV